MSVRVLPAFVAVVVAIVLAAVLFVPFVASEHRKRGELGPGTALLRFAVVLYLLGLAAYILIPLPPVAPGFCAAFADMRPQWEPFAGLAGLSRPRALTELSGLLSNSGVQQFGFNILLFVPLGMLAGHLLRRGVVTTTVLGAAVSLLVECTQLTGIWFLYPCPYRLFDVDDLIANSAGALVGAAVAPVLRLVPGQGRRARETDPGRPRPVTAYRRLLGMVCDLLLLWWLGSAVLRGADVLGRLTSIPVPDDSPLLKAFALWWLPALILFCCTALGRASTLGQHAVLLRARRSDGQRPGIGAALLRWGVGIGGLALVEGTLLATGYSSGGAVFAVLCGTGHALGVTRTSDRRGITGLAAGLTVVDARVRRHATSAASAGANRKPVVS